MKFMRLWAQHIIYVFYWEVGILPVLRLRAHDSRYQTLTSDLKGMHSSIWPHPRTKDKHVYLTYFLCELIEKIKDTAKQNKFYHFCAKVLSFFLWRWEVIFNSIQNFLLVLCLEIKSGSTWDHMQCQELNLDQLCSRPYLLYYLCSHRLGLPK